MALGVAAVFTGCASDLKLVLEGKRCSADGRCLAGYECDESLNLCLRAGSVEDELVENAIADELDEVAIDEGRSGGAGESAVDRSLGGGGGSSGTGGSATGGFPGSAGSGGTVIAAGARPKPDAGMSTLPDDGCIPMTVYRDVDGDGFGQGGEYTMGCPSAEWVTAGGDCRDDLPLVNPGQQEYFAVGYPSPGPGGISFDYDCINEEQPDPENDTNHWAPTPAACASLLGPDCIGSGFEPTKPARDGLGIEPRCGSNLRVRCVLDPLLGNCNAVEEPLGDDLVFRCR
jgi:hypothetical protein